jgi:ABC-type multidrug transport system fused ATPase/permease subunit
MEAVHSGNYFEQEEAAFREQLARVCRFSESDLAENRLGRLTSRQKASLALRIIRPLSKLMLSLIAIAFLAVAIHYFDPFTQIASLMFAGAVGLCALFFGFVAFLIKFLLASGRIWNLVRDLSESKVTSISGRLTTSQSEEATELEAALSETLRTSVEDRIVLRDYPLNEGALPKAETHCFVVKGQYFEVPKEAFDAMRDRDGRPYRIYLTPRSRYLLSLEALISTT